MLVCFSNKEETGVTTVPNNPYLDEQQASRIAQNRVDLQDWDSMLSRSSRRHVFETLNPNSLRGVEVFSKCRRLEESSSEKGALQPRD
jgi:hypothetical protein